MPIRVGIDTGGTFTDLVAVDEDGRSFLAKVPSNPDDPVATVTAALREAGAVACVRKDEALDDIVAAVRKAAGRA